MSPGEDHRARLDGAKIRFRTILDRRYKQAKIIVFGEFNLKRDQMKKDFLKAL